MNLSLTGLIERWQSGDSAAENALCKQVFPLIHRLARSQLAKNKQHTLRPTQLAGDVFLELRASFDSFSDSKQLLSLAARMMRMAIIDHIRSRKAEKHGGEFEFVDIEYAVGVEHSSAVNNEDWLVLDSAIQELINLDARTAKLVELRYFVGLSINEAAQELEIAVATANRMWRFARALLASRLGHSALAPLPDA